MSTKIIPPSVYIKDTGTPKGSGVFAARLFQPGETVETCPVVIFDGSYDALPDALKTRVFHWGVLAKMHGYAVALGYGGMYNHANPANMQYSADRAKSLLRFVTVREVAIDEELTINYNARGGGATWHDNNWFVDSNVTRI
jgi:hypothetical protein